MTNKWQMAFLGLIFAILVIAVVGGAYFLGAGRVPLPEASPQPEADQPLADAPTPPLFPDEAALIKQAVYALTGLDETEAEVTISDQRESHAKGGIREYEAVGGAYWIAAKTDEGWIGVYDGQANPTCAQIAPYNFPTDMVSECLDETGQVVSR